jgi:hypothetical protein
MFKTVTINLNDAFGIPVPEGEQPETCTIIPIAHHSYEDVEKFMHQSSAWNNREADKPPTDEEKLHIQEMVGLVVSSWTIKGRDLKPLPQPSDDPTVVWKLSTAVLNHIMEAAGADDDIPLAKGDPSSASSVAKPNRQERRALPASAPRPIG